MIWRLLMAAVALALPLAAQPEDDAEQMKPVVPPELIPPSPVLPVEKALESFVLEPGFVIEPVAAEPLVDTPVCLDFDAGGRIWVCEMRGYMPDVDGKGEAVPAGRIVVLEDTDGDGRADRRTVFLDDLLLPRALAVHEDGLLFMDETRLCWVNRDGLKPRGAVEVIDTALMAGGNVEHKPNGLLPNLDNRYYLAKSDRRLRRTEDGWQLEPTAFRGQWGIARDDFGRLFHNNNSTLLFGDLLAPNVLTANPSRGERKFRATVQLGPNRVWPARVTPAVNRAYMARANGFDSDTLDPHTHKLISATAASGMVVYRGTNFPADWYGTAFTGEPVANLVKATRISRKDGRLSGSHPLDRREFLASTDERFRPVNLHNAPDGSLYLVDMYHGIIQHSTYMTPYLREQTLSRGLDKPPHGLGRIYRIRAAEWKLEPAQDLSQLAGDQLVALLGHPNAWHRETAQRLLVERKNPAAIPALAAMVADGPVRARIHALWTLEGMGALQPAHLAAALAAGDGQLQASALWASTRLGPDQRSALEPALLAVRPAGPEVLPYLARALGPLGTRAADEKLASLLDERGLVAPAIVSGLAGRESAFLAALTDEQKATPAARLLRETWERGLPHAEGAAKLPPAERASFERGKALFHGAAACFGCHSADGAGVANLGPPLDGSEWVTGTPEILANILLHGLSGPIRVAGELYEPTAEMPGLAGNPSMDDRALADLATYIRNEWSNAAPAVSPELIARQRELTAGRTGRPFTAAELKAR